MNPTQPAPQGHTPPKKQWRYRQHAHDAKRFVLLAPQDLNDSGCGSVYGEATAELIVNACNATSHTRLQSENRALREALEDCRGWLQSMRDALVDMPVEMDTDPSEVRDIEALQNRVRALLTTLNPTEQKK